MKILVIADIHGDFEKLGELVEKLSGEKFDVIICPGDFTDMFSQPKEFSQIDIANMVVQKLSVLGAPLLCVPGNHDPYEILELFDEYGVNLHAKTIEVKGIRFVGWGGAPTPFNTIFEPSDEETKETLDSLSQRVENGKFILVTHDPPKNTEVDMIAPGKHVGSPVVREFIEKKEPIIAISAHIHESAGKEELGKTTLFYPGPLFDGKYGIVNLEGNKVHLEIKNIDEDKAEKTVDKITDNKNEKISENTTKKKEENTTENKIDN